jgi:hypothetical protein
MKIVYFPSLGDHIKIRGSVWEGRIISLWRQKDGTLEAIVHWTSDGWGDPFEPIRLNDAEYDGVRWLVAPPA